MKMDRRNRGEEEKEREEHKVDLSGMSLDSFPYTSLNLACITKLDLSNNNLESIPESMMARLLNLVVLDVHSNQLRVLPNSIGCLSKLKVIDVSSNMLEFLPKTIENCRALEEVNVNFNKLTRLPDTMGFELTNLEKLSVNSNKLVYLPFSTSHLTGLRYLDVHLNSLRSLPDGLENLIHLHTLNISQNFHFLHSLPYSIGLLQSLTDLNISYNSISTLPHSFSLLKNLKNFSAEGNPIVSPPMEVVLKGVDEVRDYMTAKMTEGFKVSGRSCNTKRSSSSSWWKRMGLKCGAFDGRMVYRNEGLLITPEHDHEEHGSSTTSVKTPSRLAGIMMSPLRVFSPGRRSFS
ncbi:hypothetical protein J5N97_003488 [Dioscorea zingiberensis]|uniref:Uncharacterized protein n=1 Tax=Dioscorea zingiberensis TaxID=325984 RepID=A0A9D5D622_9LILI|nr:hypothetical protein J5N97_003488 [Dioscorea zingiberensis]